MMNRRRVTLISLFLTLMISCGPSEYMLTVNGDTAEVRTRSGHRLEGELICFQDSSIYLRTGDMKPGVFRIAIADVERIEIQGYSNRGWVTPVIILQVVPTAILGISAFSFEGEWIEIPASGVGIFAMASIWTVATFVLFEVTTPAPPQSTRPSSIESLEYLAKYTKYPQGLTHVQLSQILKKSGQTEVNVLH